MPPFWQLLLLVSGVMSVVAFGAMGLDKRAARRGRPRWRESRLHWLEGLGGAPGSLLGQQVFRHKTRKWGYQAVFWLIVLGHAALWYAVWRLT